MRGQICSDENSDIFMLSNILVYLIMSYMHKGGKCAPGHTTHSATQKCRVHTTCCNKQHTYTYTQHMHRTQMICTNYYLQQPSSTLSMGSRREGQHGQLTWTQWTVNDTYIFAIITCFIHLQKNSIAAVSVSSGGSVAIISPAHAPCIGPATH